MIEGLVSFFPEEEVMGIGAIKMSKSMRISLAESSKGWYCDVCRKSNLGIWENHIALLQQMKIIKTETDTIEEGTAKEEQ